MVSRGISRGRGFTLIEVMIAVVIIGIASKIALSSFQSYQTKSRRATAQAHVMEIGQRQQQYLLDSRAYAPDLTTLNVTTPTAVSTYYTITVAAVAGTPPTYTITATPKSGTTQAVDSVLTLDQSGVKTPSDKW